MRFVVLISLLIATSVARAVPAPRPAEVCVLLSERQGHPYAQLVARGLRSLAHPELVWFKPEADLDDVIRCVRSPSVRRVVWLAHAATIADSDGVNLVYFKRVPEDEYAASRATAERAARERVAELAGDDFPGGSADPTNARFAERARIERFLTRLARDPRLPLYPEPLPVFDRFFTRVAAALAERARPLERFALMACQRERLAARYPSFARLETAADVRLAPSGPISSFIWGHDVTPLDMEWVRRQIEQ